MSRGPHYDIRIGLPFKDLARSFFPRLQHSDVVMNGRRIEGVILKPGT